MHYSFIDTFIYSLSILFLVINMTVDEHQNISELTKRLDVIIYLLMKQNQERGGTTRQMIKELNDIGLKDIEIAKIFGRSRSYIASELTLIRKSKVKNSEGGKNGERSISDRETEHVDKTDGS